MFDRVLDHGLENQAGNLSGKEFPGDIDTYLKPLGKSHLLNVQILLCELQFLFQRHLLPIGIFHDPAQKVAQPGNHAHGHVVFSLAHEASDGIERIEQKVRLDLSPKSIELCLRELGVETRGLGLLKSQPLTGVQHVADQDNGAVKDQVGEKPVVELV